jgi:two-component system phosphate regulon response regulator PhoB
MKVLWVEPDKRIVDQTAASLPSSAQLLHHQSFHSLQSEQILWSEIELLILDLHFDGVDPFQVMNDARKKNADIKIILTGENTNKEQFILAINLGVNAFIEKPFRADILKTTLDRFFRASDELPLNHERKAVFSENRWVDLTSTEYRILETLKVSRRRMTRAELQAAVWPGSSISDNNLDTHLTNLKRKIPSLNQYLNVKRGLGYFLTLRKSGS